MKSALKFSVIMCVVFLSGCGNYYHYGLKTGIAKSVLPQEDQFYVTGDYEFKSVLFISNDKNLIISIRHPVHPIPKPEKFISQIEFELINSEQGSYQVSSIDFSHQTLNGAVIEPIENTKIKNSFYVLTYNESQLSREIRENININFSYNGTASIIKFSEVVKKVKRWSKISVLLNS